MENNAPETASRGKWYNEKKNQKNLIKITKKESK